MSKLHIPAEVMEKMKCLGCKKYLSVFPVHTKTDSSGGICGRCSIPEPGIYLRDEPFENIAQYLVFPCMYDGCKQILAPASMAQHESCCVHRKYECPTKNYSRCDWKGALRGATGSDLLTHFQEKHNDLVLSNQPFDLSFLNTIEENMLLCKLEELFIVKKEIDARRGLCFWSVEHLKASENSKNYMYYLKFESSGDKDYSYRSPEKATKPNYITKLTMDFLKERLHDPAGIIVNIEIIESREEDIEKNNSKSEPSEDHPKNPEVQWPMLSELECPICLEYMLPPIYQCLRGHSICARCKARVRDSGGACPTCKGAFQDTQNFSLERLAQLMVYPCKYHRAGCSYAARSDRVGAHEGSCEFGPYECPLKEEVGCEWKASSAKVIEHVENNHDDNILKVAKMQVPFAVEETREEIKLVSSFGKLFKIYFQYRTEKFYWAVQLVGPASENKNYKFEVDVIDMSGEKKRFFLMGNVSPLVPKKFILQNRGRYLVATLEQLEVFIKGDISFRINVVKN